MGIPFYFKHLVTQYADIVLPLNQLNDRCNRLYLDFNCAIHHAAQAILQKHPTMPDAPLEEQILHDVVQFVKKLISRLRPKSLVYIAVDGVCPVAKMVQQRKRRYIGHWRQHLLRAEAKKHGIPMSTWDNNAITPGTPFMTKLNVALHAFANAWQQANARASAPTLIVSDSNESGEGEHKIYEHLRMNPVDASQGVDIVYGLDADLIMLSLISSAHIYLLREKPVFNIPGMRNLQDSFLVLDVARLRNALYDDLHARAPDPVHVPADTSTIFDYVVLCFLLGNDFLPSLSFIKIKEQGVDLLIQLYMDVRCLLNGAPLYDHEKKGVAGLNTQFLTLLLARLSAVEDASMDEVTAAYYKRTVGAAARFSKRSSTHTPVDTLSSSLDNYPTWNKLPQGLIDPSQHGWRLSYYHHLFPQETSAYGEGCGYSCTDVNAVCRCYLHGIGWTLSYYFDGPQQALRQPWHYPYNYSPTLLDVSNYVSTHQATLLEDIQTGLSSLTPIHIEPQAQLLCVLPPTSKTLLPPVLQAIMNEVQWGCVHCYPVSFKLCTFLKTYLWEVSPMLPPLPFNKIIACYQKARDQENVTTVEALS